jgi:hypothetical protein
MDRDERSWKSEISLFFIEMGLPGLCGHSVVLNMKETE